MQKKQQPKAFSWPGIVTVYSVGIAIRSWLIFSDYQKIISSHIEVSTPLNAWKRVSEGLYLRSQGINPYDGDLLHEGPITMFLYETLIQHMGVSIEIIFLVVDLLSAALLHWTARKYLFHLFVKQEEDKKDYHVDSAEILMTGSDFRDPPIFVAAAFLFNPYTVFNCVGMSTTVFHNFFLSLFLAGMLSGSVILSVLPLALATTMSFYPVILIIPLFLNFKSHFKNDLLALGAVCTYITTLIGLKIVSSFISHGDGYLRNVYGFILTVPDLQPNIGLFWYFFTEMFDHFRDLFICSFQINATVLYLFPLSFKFRKDPFLLTAALLFLVAVFKSYPCLGDVGFALTLLPCFMHLFSFSQQGFLVGVILLITTALGPIVWHLWIYSNSANANFYFGVTLAFAIAQIFLVTDILFAHLKREFCLKHGNDRTVDGKEALLVLE